MATLILSTSNIMGSSPTVIRRPITQKSNLELTASLRANFATAQHLAQQKHAAASNGNAANGGPGRPPYEDWTLRSGNDIQIPTLDFASSGLGEERASYEITVKLFFLPNASPSRRCAQAREAVNLVLKELHMPSIDLLILSFPGVSFDGEDVDDATLTPSGTNAGCADLEATAEDLDTMIETWECLEQLHDEGVIDKLGVAEFGEERLSKFLQRARIRPSVNQINVRDCCVVPRPLIMFAKQEKIDLLTHNDCTNILPRGTLRDLLGPREKGAGILGDPSSPGDGLQGDVVPQWVSKYTAVVKDRGVVENKGYFAVATLHSS